MPGLPAEAISRECGSGEVLAVVPRRFAGEFRRISRAVLCLFLGGGHGVAFAPGHDFGHFLPVFSRFSGFKGCNFGVVDFNHPVVCHRI